MHTNIIVMFDGVLHEQDGNAQWITTHYCSERDGRTVTVEESNHPAASLTSYCKRDAFKLEKNWDFYSRIVPA